MSNNEKRQGRGIGIGKNKGLDKTRDWKNQGIGKNKELDKPGTTLKGQHQGEL